MICAARRNRRSCTAPLQQPQSHVRAQVHSIRSNSHTGTLYPTNSVLQEPYREALRPEVISAVVPGTAAAWRVDDSACKSHERKLNNFLAVRMHSALEAWDIRRRAVRKTRHASQTLYKSYRKPARPHGGVCAGGSCTHSNMTHQKSASACAQLQSSITRGRPCTVQIESSVCPSTERQGVSMQQIRLLRSTWRSQAQRPLRAR